MKRLIWLPVAGFLLIAGATVAAAGGQILSVTPAAPPASSDGATLELRATDLLDEVLADLVGQGVITQDQSDAIVGALESAIEERRADAEARVEQMRETWQQVRSFIEDGVITQDEIDTLPEDSPLREVFDSIAEEGEVTLDQLRQLGPGFGGPGGPGGHGGHGGHGRGGIHFQFDGTKDFDIQPVPDGDSDADSDSDSDEDADG